MTASRPAREPGPVSPLERVLTALIAGIILLEAYAGVRGALAGLARKDGTAAFGILLALAAAALAAALFAARVRRYAVLAVVVLSALVLMSPRSIDVPWRQWGEPLALVALGVTVLRLQWRRGESLLA